MGTPDGIADRWHPGDDPEPQIWIIDYFLLTLWRYLFPGLPWKIDNSVVNRNILLILFNYD